MRHRLNHPKRNRHRGFSLLELLVAFAIMSMSLGLLYRVTGGSARHVSDAALAQQAAWLTESLLASRSSVLAGGWNEVGESAGFKWQIRSNPLDGGNGNPQAVPLHVIRVATQWTAGSRPGQLEVVTLLPERKLRPGEEIR